MNSNLSIDSIGGSIGLASVTQEQTTGFSEGPHVDTGQARSFLMELFAPDELIEVHFVETWTENGRKRSGSVDEHCCARDDALEELDRWAIRNGSPELKNVLVGACPRPRMDRALAHEILSTRAVWIDVGSADPDAFTQTLQSLEIPGPTLLVSDGQSLQAFWSLQPQFSITCSADRGQFHRLARRLAQEVGGHPAQINDFVPLPGFLNLHDARNGRSPVRFECTQIRPGPCRFDALETSLDAVKGRIHYPDSATEPPDTGPASLLDPELVGRAREELERPTDRDETFRDVDVVTSLITQGLGHNACRGVVCGYGGFTDADGVYFERIWHAAQAELMLSYGGPPRRKFPKTDLGNAERLIAYFGQEIRYVECWKKWLVWDSRAWRVDDNGELMRMGRMTVRSMYRDVKAEFDQRAKGELASFAVRSESERALTAMIRLARSDRTVAIRPAQLDSDGWRLNCRNGTVDLRTGELCEHRREDLITKLAPVDYDPRAKCPRWRRFLREVFAGNLRLIHFLQRYFGMALTGDIGEQFLLLLTGGGSNGKSVFMDTIVEMMGDYATRAAPDLLTTSGGDRHPTEIADLAGRRLVVSSETEEGRRMRVQLIKQATGDVALKGRRMREDYWTFDRQFKLVLVTNNLPRVREESHAIWRRLKVVPFNVTVREEDQDRQLIARLRQEWPGILRWAVRGCLAWRKCGLRFPAAVAAASEQYRAQEDLMEQFLGDCCILGSSPACAITRRAIRKAYGVWAKDLDERYTLSRNSFYRRLRQIPGVTEIDATHPRGFQGVGLARPADFLDYEERKVEAEFLARIAQGVVPARPALATSGGMVAPGKSPTGQPTP